MNKYTPFFSNHLFHVDFKFSFIFLGMFEFITEGFKAIGDFITKIFSDFWTGMLAIVVIIVLGFIIVALINARNNRKVERVVIVDGARKEDEQNKKV